MNRSCQEPRESHRLKRLTTSILQCVSKAPCLHPIHAICVIVIIVSTTYLGLLKDDISHPNDKTEPVDGLFLAERSRNIFVGPETDWKWQSLDGDSVTSKNAPHLALLTLAFPVGPSTTIEAPPPPGVIPYLSRIPISLLSQTPQPLTAFAAQESHIAFSVQFDSTPDLLAALQKIPGNAPHAEQNQAQAARREHKMWIMKDPQTHTRTGLFDWIDDAYDQLLDLLKHSSALDTATMALIYISMHLTFVSLFFSMKRLGSHVWLATTVLLSSTFAFLLGLDVSIRLGVPVSLRLLSESMPFLVVIIGFEKSIVLTRSVLSHAARLDKDQRIHTDLSVAAKGDPSDPSKQLVFNAVQEAINEKGYDIALHYLFEILILAGGARSGIHGGLQQVCFLGAWILAFDFLLLFTFYTPVLCIRLEIARIRRTISRQYNKGNNKQKSTSLFGNSLKALDVPHFKIWMAVGFVAVNIVDMLLASSRMKAQKALPGISLWSGGLDGVVKAPLIEPFKVAGSGLSEILLDAMSRDQRTIVTVMAPIKYQLTYPSLRFADHHGPGSDTLQLDQYGTVGAKMVDSLLTSFEDPVLSKWIIAALALSIALNGYLFKAAKLGFDESATASTSNQLTSLNKSRSKSLTSLAGRSTELVKVESSLIKKDQSHRDPEDFATVLKEQRVHELDDNDVVEACLNGKLPGHALEKNLKDCKRAVKIRRSIVSRTPATARVTSMLADSKLPYEHYEWERVLGACCENVIGYTPVPVGVAGPLVIDGKSYYIPMATTEGVLVASASRGSKAINLGGGVSTILTGDGMTRGPCVCFDAVERAGAAKDWLDSEAGQDLMRESFNSTSRFARLQSIKTTIAGTYLFIRFKASTGDAMGMNMISKGVEHALNVMSNDAGFSDMKIVTLSGNYCADKKHAALNWIEGRGKGIVAEAVIPSDAVKDVLKSDVDSMVELNHAKNLVGSAMAGSVGGFNAQAANLACALLYAKISSLPESAFEIANMKSSIATGQDPAQVVEAANCMTLMKKRADGALQISVTLPSIEVGTLGGGTILEPQGAMLDMLGVRGSHQTAPGENARQFARIVASAVLAGETSLCAALAAGHLVKAHMAHNRPSTAKA